MCSTWDISSLTGIEPLPPAVEAQNINHWTAREVPKIILFFLRGKNPPETLRPVSKNSPFLLTSTP